MDEVSQPSVQPPSGGWYKATILRRYFASFIDGIIVALIYLGLQLLLSLVGIVNSSNNMSLSWLLWLIALQYMVLMTWRNGAPLGKMWLKIKVVRTDGSNLSLGRAFLREVIGKFISGLVLYLGYLWAIWDKNRQAWHDKIADTYVVTKIPNSGGKSGCLVALVIGAVAFIPIAAILAAVVVLIINPLELTRRGRDAARLTDGVIVQQAINTFWASNPETGLCADGSIFCVGVSTEPGANSTEGTGWVKVTLPKTAFNEGVLPVDPINDGNLVYTYCSDGTDWEINFILESEQQKAKMVSDGGDNNNIYELGSDLILCK